MKLSNSGKIKYKILKERNIQDLIKLFIRFKNELNHERTKLRLEIHYEDGTSRMAEYEGEASVLEDAANIFDDTKLIKSISFELKNYDLDKIATIMINKRNIEYTVTSKDQNWIDSKVSQIENEIKVTPNQNLWLSKPARQDLIIYFTGFLLTIVFFFGFIDMFNAKAEDLSSVILPLGLSLMLGQIIPRLLFTYFLFGLYPEIEFDTTLEHINLNKKRKALAIASVVVVFIPLAISFITSLVF